jgi:hypothetical protein
MLEAIDRYKFGIIAVLVVYFLIFMWTQFDTLKSEVIFVPFTQTGQIDTRDELELTPENIDVSERYSQDILNMANNVSDGRETSEFEFFENQTPLEASKSIKELEQQMIDDAGGSKERDRLEGLIADRKARQQEILDNKANEAKPDGGPSGDKKYAGQTMVNFDLSGRDAYQNNKWFVRNPGYKCDNNSRVSVYIDIKVGADGYVTSASYNSSKSSGASSCEINTSLKYAKKSRFEYKANGGDQSGWISYVFMPK